MIGKHRSITIPTTQDHITRKTEVKTKTIIPETWKRKC